MTQISWALRLLAADGSPAAGISIQLQVFDLAGGWRRLADAATASDGTIRGKADDGTAKPVTAPMLRLVETARPAAILGGVPTLAAAGTPPSLSADFGDIVHVPAPARAEPRTAPKRATLGKLAVEEVGTIAGVAAPVAAALPSATAFRDVEARLSQRELDLNRVTGERDSLADRVAAFEPRLAESEKKLAERELDLKKVTGERDALAGQLATSQPRLAESEKRLTESEKKLAERELDLKRVAGERDALAGRLAASEPRLAESDKRLAERELDLKRVTSERDSLAGRLAASEPRLAESEKRLAARELDLKRVTSERDALAGRLAASEPRLTETEKRLAARELDLDRLTSERDALNGRLEASETKVADSEKRIAALQQQLADAVAKPTGARETLGTTFGTIGTTTSAPVSLGDFATKVGGEIGSAQTALRATGFSLGSVQITARTVVEGGSSLVFPDTETLKTVVAGSLSDIKLSFEPTQTAEASEGSVQVPDIRDLTESAARRVLASVGLVLEVSHGPLGMRANCAPGQAMLQAPGPGTTAARGATVLAVFARGPA
ncbi:hypothetical protein E2493_11930 [Sphingomonas parva]|uniref:PASTA domain-containing protein n=1 Tax=Sphingomonas parva TaxID=2555898 RepID=A0A4Y8ZQ63_9SPHN|nr:hypothetical protein [Sphingomonas parva]TFI58104.1 hypothetical protein E2493_11930 [Sphingomonas parva]